MPEGMAITIAPGLSELPIKQIQLLRIMLDAALAESGYRRGVSSYCDDKVVFNYYLKAGP
jgi:hypothetical protein